MYMTSEVRIDTQFFLLYNSEKGIGPFFATRNEREDSIE